MKLKMQYRSVGRQHNSVCTLHTTTVFLDVVVFPSVQGGIPKNANVERVNSGVNFTRNDKKKEERATYLMNTNITIK